MRNPLKIKATTFIIIWFLCIGENTFSQKTASSYVNQLGQLNYSSLDFWYARKVKESSLLSGKTIELFGVGKVDANSDFYNTKLKDEKSPWGTTNIYSKMVLDIGNTRVFPEKRGNGYCCRLETGIRKDNRLVIKNPNGDIEQISSYHEDRYVLADSLDESLLIELQQIEENERASDLRFSKDRKEILDKLNLIFLKDYRKTHLS